MKRLRISYIITFQADEAGLKREKWKTPVHARLEAWNLKPDR